MNKIETLIDVKKTLLKKIVDLETYVFVNNINVDDDNQTINKNNAKKNNFINYLYKTN